MHNTNDPKQFLTYLRLYAAEEQVVAFRMKGHCTANGNKLTQQKECALLGMPIWTIFFTSLLETSWTQTTYVIHHGFTGK